MMTICIKSKCDIGENEKCFSCQTEEGSKNNCLSCNDGYYLSENDNDKTKCKKFQIEGCKSCDKYQGICDQCKKFYEPVINNGSIIEYKLICDFGEKNKCKTCNLENKNKCGSCNIGYKLMKNGTCIKLENSFTAIYDVK